MRPPSFTPSELSYCADYTTAAEAFSALKAHSIGDAVLFFETAAQDETWMKKEGSTLVQLLFEWFNTEFRNRRLSLTYAERIATSAQEHHKALKPYLEADITCVVEDTPLKVSSLIFGAASPVFCELIWKEIFVEKQSAVRLQRISSPLFGKIQEFAYTGSLPDLWKEESSFILSLLLQAQRWKMEALEAFCADVFKRYLTPDNVWEYFQLAQKESLSALCKECCLLLNRQLTGVVINADDPHQMHVEITRLTEEGTAALVKCLPFLTQIKCHFPASEDPAFADLLAKKSKLDLLDLSETTQIHPRCLDVFPDTRTLLLATCPWLSDAVFIQIIERSPRLTSLYIAQNPQLTYRSWAALASARQLAVLDVSECRSLNDEDLDLLSVSCPQLSELHLSRCERITSRGLQNLLKNGKKLISLDLSHCRSISEEGFFALAAAIAPLEQLNLSDCPELSERALFEIVNAQKGLKFLFVENSPLSPSALSVLEEKYPHLHVK